MSKITKRRSIRLENLQNNSRTNLNHMRSPRNSPNTQFKNSLLCRNKLDIKFTKVSKPAKDFIFNQQPQRSIFRPGSLFGPKDKSNGPNQELPNTSNSTTNERVSNGYMSCSNSTSNAFKQFSISSATLDDKNNSDSSTTFYEPDSTVDDDLDTNFLFDSNGPIDDSVLTKITDVSIPIVSKSSFERVTSYETPKENLSMKKSTQFRPSTLQKAKIGRKVKPNDLRKSQARCKQDLSFGEMSSSSQNYCPKNIRSNLTKKVVAAAKRANLNQLSQHHSIVNSKGEIEANLPTSNLNSKPSSVSPELFASDYDNNQISSNDLVLPSPDDSILHGHTLVSRNRLKTPQDTNSISTTPMTNPSYQMKKPSRYPLRSITSSSVSHELPTIHRIQSNSSSALTHINDSWDKISVRKSKIPFRKPIASKSSLFSQCSSVHQSLLDINTPRNTQTQNDVCDIDKLRNTRTQDDVYNFVSNSPPRKLQNRKKKKKGNNWSQRSRALKSTTAKKASQTIPTSDSSIPAAIMEPSFNASTKKKPQTPKTKIIFNPSFFSDLTNNQISRITRAASSQVANKEGNFLSGMFSQVQSRSTQPSTFFNSSNSQGFRNLTLNPSQMLLKQSNIQSQRYSQTYGSLLTYIDNINHNNTDIEMDELCDLFKLLKISDLRTHLKTSFLTYRDPGRIQKFCMKRIDQREKSHRKISFSGNTFMNYRLSSKSIVEENKPLFASIPTKNVINCNNYCHSKCVLVTPSKSDDANKDTNLSARAVMKTISTISRKVPHCFYADGEFDFDGFSDWD